MYLLLFVCCVSLICFLVLGVHYKEIKKMLMEESENVNEIEKGNEH